MRRPKACLYISFPSYCPAVSSRSRVLERPTETASLLADGINRLSYLMGNGFAIFRFL